VREHVGEYADVIRMRRVSVLLLAAAATGCGSSHRSASGRVVVSARGRIGPLQVDRSTRADVISFAGRPQSERCGRYARPYLPFDALGYECKRNGATDKAGVPGCKTVFYVDPRGGKLELLYTEDRRYVDPHGVHPGTRARSAERLAAAADMRGCGSRSQHREDDPSKVVMAAKRPDFRRECGREDSNLHGALAPTGPKPAAYPSSATPAVTDSIDPRKPLTGILRIVSNQ
jgi:hypothetical protein